MQAPLYDVTITCVSMLRNTILVGVGGMLGSIARYLSVYFMSRLMAIDFPIGTFVVNVLGCFIIGLAAGFAGRYFPDDQGRLLFVATGFCGGFTTFSAFALENVELLTSRSFFTSASYVAVSVIVCIIAAFLGLFAARNW
ncbi:MAG: fluoride efflux transporter CrcB [Acidobacteria bacterium]|nr:fluoride efflux transporter CrcB [Acidobacteriota bacterium]